MNDTLTRIHVVTGDITKLEVDAVVTAANEGLRGGGGVDGAVHRAAGPELLQSCRAKAPCPAGEARITDGFNLHARYVIHAVGPIYHGGGKGETQLLRSAYIESLSLAAANDVGHVAFPCISTGVYGYPKQEACQIALDAVVNWLRSQEAPRQVTMCCFSDEDAVLYQERLRTLSG